MNLPTMLIGGVLASATSGLTFWVGVVAGVMILAITVIMTFLTLAPRFSERWADRLGEHTDEREAVDYREVIEGEPSEAPSPDGGVTGASTEDDEDESVDDHGDEVAEEEGDTAAENDGKDSDEPSDATG